MLSTVGNLTMTCEQSCKFMKATSTVMNPSVQWTHPFILSLQTMHILDSSAVTVSAFLESHSTDA